MLESSGVDLVFRQFLYFLFCFCECRRIEDRAAKRQSLVGLFKIPFSQSFASCNSG